MLQHYVMFYYPGLFVSETSSRPVKSRKAKVKLPPGAYAYRFYSRECAIVKGEKCLGDLKNFSPTYYLGTELTAAQAIKEGNEVVRSNIKINGYKRLVRTAQGQMFPLERGDVVLGVK